MAEYIERQALLAEYDRVHVGPPGGARKLIEEAPAADVVPVVRCVNCVHFGSEAVAFDAFAPFCLKHMMSVFPDDFCSYGERKDGDSDEG